MKAEELMLRTKSFAPLSLTPEELIAYTPEWKGERFPNGRPKVPDEILQRMEKVTIEEAWSVLRNEGYEWQFEGGWMSTSPGHTLVGRAVTAVYMPRREDVRRLIFQKAEEAGCIGDQVSWPIDTLVEGDVYVADIFGKIEYGAVVGSNLSTSVYAKTGKGVVHDGSVRDIEKVRKIEGYVGFFRGYHPTAATSTIMLMGINTPVRIGGVTVMPGDIVLAKDEGVVFIPPHLAEKVVITSEIIRLRDTFGEIRLREGKYTPGEIDRRWTPNIEEDFAQWVEDHIDELPVPKETIQEYLKKRTW
ncbi:MAG: RraA family protein [Anaerolineae bacterium]|nr:RraA family protein [Anaerolineae bacterium]